MKRFRFPLERVLEFRRQQEDLEWNRLYTLAAQREHLLEHSRQLEAQSRLERAQCVSSPGIAALDVRRAFDYAQALGRSRENTLQRAGELDRERKEQAQAVLQSRRKVRLLELLRGRHWALHARAADREQDALAGELHRAKMRREQSEEKF